MPTSQQSLRTDTVSRVILAPPRALYRAHLDAEMIANWRTPDGMRAQLLAFDGRLGGGYRMALYYLDESNRPHGKSGRSDDRFTGVFEELVPDEKIVERIRFETDDPAFAQPMTIITTLRAVTDGTKVTVSVSNVKTVISKEDHLAGLGGALRKLAALTE